MADIAMLVAEEYERRVNCSKKAGFGEGEEEVGLVSGAAVLAQSLVKKIGEGKLEVVKWMLEPKSQIGVAASNCFFSA